MNVLFYSFLLAGAVSFLWTGLDLLRVKGDASSEYRTYALLSSFIVSFIVNIIILYWTRPTEHGLFWGKGWWFIDVLIAGIAFGLANFGRSSGREHVSLAPIATIVFALWYVVWAIGSAVAPFSDGAAKDLANILKIEQAEYGEYPETDPSKIIQASEDVAVTKASQIMASGAHTFNNRPIETAYEREAPILQLVNDHAYWVVALKLKGIFNANGVNNTVPGYILVDAENPDATAEVRLGFEMKYVPSSFWGSKLERHIYASGYQGYILDDLTLEVNDEYVPYYTIALSQYLQPNQKEGLRPVKMLVIDPQTGDITEYALSETPEWVDRVYSAGTTKDLVSYWGRWANAPRNFFKETNANRFNVAGDPNLVFTTDGKVAWQFLLTSKGSDVAASRIVLVNARTGESKMYKPPTQVTIESNVLEVMRSVQQNTRNYKPVFPQLYRIYGVLTWVSPYSQEGDRPTFAAIGLMPADKAQSSDVSFSSTSLDEALRLYRQNLATNGGSADPNQNIESKSTEGVIAEVGSAVINGNSLFYVMLEGNDAIFIGVINDNPELAFASKGDEVRIRYNDFADPQGRVDVGEFNILQNA